MSIGRVIYADQRFFLNGQEVKGAQSHAPSSELAKEPILIAGYGLYSTNKVSAPVSSKNDVSFLISDLGDAVASGITGVFSGVSAFRTGGTGEYNSLSFSNGRVTSYSIACDTDSMPRVSASFDIVGGYSTGVLVASEPSYSGVILAAPYELRISGLSENDTNILKSIEYSVSVAYNNRAVLGQFNTDNRQTPKQATISTRFSMDLSEYAPSGFVDLVCDEAGTDIRFSFVDCATDNEIRAFAMPDARLKNWSIKGEIGSDASLELLYESIVPFTGLASGLLGALT